MAAAAGVGAAARPFLLSLGLDADVLDLSPGGTGIKTYNKAIMGLDTKFDGSQENIVVFLSEVAIRADTHGWRPQLTIPVGAPPTNRDLINDYGRI
jgi:hypothetical protein